MTDFALKVLKHYSPTENDGFNNDLWWRTDGEFAPVTFFVNCNDVFAWGFSDCETITEENFPVLQQAYKDSENNGAELFCARVRKMRPQGAWYSYCPEKEWPLFNDAGPEREKDIINPYAPGEYKR
jgi:hypothetical protein